MTITARTFTAAGVASAQFLDISNWQGLFDAAGAKASVPDLRGIIFRATQGLGGPGTASPDPDAAHNHAAIRDAGLHRGAYHFLDPHLPGDKQAEYFVSELGRLGIVDTDIMSLDTETAGASVTQVADCNGLFMETLVKLRPHNPRWVYSFIDFIKAGNCAGMEHYPLWLAFPNATAPVPPPPWVKWTGWQWGTRPAGGETVDADAFNGTAAQFDSWIASFAPAKPGQHVTSGSESPTELAASRGMSVQGWLSLQAKLGGQAMADALAASPAKAGLPWFTVN